MADPFFVSVLDPVPVQRTKIEKHSDHRVDFWDDWNARDKAGFRPDQPRDTTGRWTETGASEEEVSHFGSNDYTLSEPSIRGSAPASPQEELPPIDLEKPETFVERGKEMDRAWKAYIKTATFSLGEEKAVGASHGAWIKDQNGKEFLFKEYEKRGTRAWLSVPKKEVYAAQAARLIDPDRVGVYEVEIDGHKGVVQPKIPDVDEMLMDRLERIGIDDGYKRFSKENLERLARETVVDHVIYNSDAHWKQFLFDKNDKLHCIDKGLAWTAGLFSRSGFNGGPEDFYQQPGLANRTIWPGYQLWKSAKDDPRAYEGKLGPNSILPAIRAIEKNKEAIFAICEKGIRAAVNYDENIRPAARPAYIQRALELQRKKIEDIRGTWRAYMSRTFPDWNRFFQDEE